MTAIELPPRITLRVTQSDIGEGAEGDCEFCAAALAAKRLFPALDPIVGSAGYIDLEHDKRRVATYEDASGEFEHFVERFDNGHGWQLKPQSFDLERVANDGG